MSQKPSYPSHNTYDLSPIAHCQSPVTHTYIHKLTPSLFSENPKSEARNPKQTSHSVILSGAKNLIFPYLLSTIYYLLFLAFFTFASLNYREATAGWLIQTVDTGPVGESTSLAFDASGKPAISYMRRQSSVGPDNLKYAHFNGSLWDITTVDEGAMDDMYPFTSLAFHPLSGNPAISYYDLGNSVLKYAFFNGTAWVITPVDSIDSASIREEDGDTSLAFDTSGNPAIAYCDDGDPHSGTLKFAYPSSCPTTVSPECVGEDCPLAFDPVSGNPAISYVKDSCNNEDRLQYASCNGTTWNINTVEGVGEDNMDEEPSLAFDASGKPAIAYVVEGNLKYAHFNGTTWDITIVDSAVGGGNFLAFDSSGNPAIAYERGTNIKYAHFNGATWNITTIDAGSGPSLAFDADGKPAISYMDDTNGNLKLARLCQCPVGSPLGCISGKVTKKKTGEPLAGKTVQLKRISPKRPPVNKTTTTDNNGCYSFTDLVNGRYKIKVSSCRGGGRKTKKITGGGKVVNDVNFQCK